MKLIPIKGMILCTNNPQRYTNSIVVETNKDETLILSDFGNLMSFKTDEVGEYYTVSENWKEAMLWEYPLPSVLERIYEQMENLADAARHIRTKEGKGEMKS